MHNHVGVAKLSEQVEATNGAKLVSGNTTKPTHGEAVGKGNLNLGRRMIVQKAILPTPSSQETWLRKGTMKRCKDAKGHKTPIAITHKVWAPTIKLTLQS